MRTVKRYGHGKKNHVWNAEDDAQLENPRNDTATQPHGGTLPSAH